MFGEGQTESSHIYIPPLLEDEDRDVEADASEDLPPGVETGNGYLPVWVRESSKSFRWGWVPLPLRKAGRAVARWVKGPVPPEVLLLTPLFPQIQALPVRFLERFFPKRKQKVSLLILLYITWFLPWFIVLIHSRSAGYIEGYGVPQTLSCATTYWFVWSPRLSALANSLLQGNG